MANFMSSRKSSNVQDVRKKPVRDAFNLANELQRTVDDAVLMKNTASMKAGFKARKVEREVTKLLDAQGTKGKGRIGAGRGYVNRLEQASERVKWRSK